MNPSDILSGFDFLSCNDTSAERHPTNSRETFMTLLKKERARAERLDSPFSLIAFDVDSFNLKSVNQELLQSLFKRIRPIDEIGWLGDNTIGILLPETPLQGALNLCSVLKNRFSELSSLEHRVYTYPYHPPNAEDTIADTPASNQNKAAGARKEDIQKPTYICDMTQLFGSKMPLWKRFFDMTCALLSLLVFSPIFLSMAILIKIVSPGPVIFKQKRVGYLGKPFMCLKFRTMRIGSNESVHAKHLNHLMKKESPLVKLDDSDPRIIPFGMFLRKSCIDELPQLINVLKGEMSIVGPRPELYNILEGYHLWHTRRFDVTPGLTGLWQVNGKNRTTFKGMMRLDIEYVQHRSPWYDLKIILKTIPAIFNQIRNRPRALSA